MWILLSVALAAPDAEALKSAWEVVLPAVQRDALQPATLPPETWARLAAGEVARSRQALEGPDRVLGAVWTDAPRDALWIAILDDRHFDLVDGLTEEQLPGTGPQRKLLYQRIDMPWPVEDRQWVIDIRSNAALSAATGGAAWERAWTLGKNELATQADAAAVWSTVNEGAWFLVEAAGGTLLVYQVRADIGGSVPDQATDQWSWSKMEELLRGTVRRAAQVPAHYDARHTPVQRPDGTAIPPWP